MKWKKPGLATRLLYPRIHGGSHGALSVVAVAGSAKHFPDWGLVYPRVGGEGQMLKVYRAPYTTGI